MNTEVLYKVFETATEKNVDTTMAAEILRGTEFISDNDRKKQVNEFIGLHFDALRRAYGTGSKKLFDDIVRICEKSNDEEADMLLRAHATGNEKLIKEMEAKHGAKGEANDG